MEIILEDIREKFDLVLEGHETLRGDIRETRQAFNEKLDLVNFKVDTLHQRVENVREGLTDKIENVREGLTDKIENVREELVEKIDNVREELVEKIDNVEAGLSEKIDAVAEDLAAHRADTESHRKGYKVSDG